jgi:hypothetical protein
MNPVVRSDILVSRFLDSVGGYRQKERRDKLLDILDVDLDWYAMVLLLLFNLYRYKTQGICMRYLTVNDAVFSLLWA